MENTEHSLQEEVSKLEKEYDMLLKLWASGSRDYINLTYSYLTANSILVAAIAIILKIEDKSIVVALSVIGIILCIQMYIGLSLLRTQNAYWRRNLKIIENKGDWKKEGRYSYVNEFYKFRDGDDICTEQRALPSKGGEPKFKPDFAIKHHNEFWLSRINVLPLLFVMVYAVFIIHAFIAIPIKYVVVAIVIIYLVLSYLLKYFSDC
ncbi:hypothetical protein IPdc08_01129 [archaeon]|nr:hypothetical protein IPdc08_01129 [archaeon]